MPQNHWKKSIKYEYVKQQNKLNDLLIGTKISKILWILINTSNFKNTLYSNVLQNIHIVFFHIVQKNDSDWCLATIVFTNEITWHNIYSRDAVKTNLFLMPKHRNKFSDNNLIYTNQKTNHTSTKRTFIKNKFKMKKLSNDFKHWKQKSDTKITSFNLKTCTTWNRKPRRLFFKNKSSKC